MRIIEEFLLILITILITFIYLFSFSKKIDEKYENLYLWGSKNGAICNKIQIKYLSRNNRYIEAAENINKKENIVTIPESLIISEVNPLIKPTCKKYNVQDQICLSVFICEELKNSNNFFYDFFEFLPNDLNSFPLLYEEKYRKMIEGSQLMDTLKSFNKQFVDEHGDLKVK
jgi:hypothetical protein